MRNFLRELKAIGIHSPQSRKDIVKAFCGGNAKNEAEIKRNRKKVFNLLMGEDAINTYFLDNMGLSDDNISKLDKCLSEREFYDVKTLFGILRDFINENYQMVDMVAYKYNSSINTLEIISGKDSLAINIKIDEINKEDIYNEYLAFQSETSKFKHSHFGTESFDGGIGAIKLSMSKDTYVFSFYLKEGLIVEDEESINNDILKIKKIFTKYGLLHRIKDIIKYIDARYKDELTGLYNKNYITSLPKHLKTNVLFIDVDRFKAINDNFGHQSGDIVLQEIGKILSNSVGTGERVCRISGDEFLILIRSNDTHILEQYENVIKTNITNNPFFFKNHKSGEFEEVKVSVSIGRGCCSNHKTLFEIIKEADYHMYKKKGKEGCLHRIIQDFNQLSAPEQIEFIKMGICNGKCAMKKALHNNTEFL